MDHLIVKKNLLKIHISANSQVLTTAGSKVTHRKRSPNKCHNLKDAVSAQNNPGYRVRENTLNRPDLRIMCDKQTEHKTETAGSAKFVLPERED